MNKKIGKAMVVGAGISGIRAALDLAEAGYGVALIDRTPHIGGILSQLDNQFPNNRCGMCKILPLVARDAAGQFCLRKGLFHENIDILLNTEITAVEGEPGNFRVTLHHKPTWVDPDRCVGCDACTPVCPVNIPDTFNAGLGTRKAIHLPVPHAIPNPYVIDQAACTRCGACAEACPTDAIVLDVDKRKDFRILVVDDELIVRDSLKAWLDEENFSVETAASGAAALAKLAEGSFSLMLTDIKMPGMDGVEVLEKAREMVPELTVIMMTAYATVETAVAAMKIGALDYLVKPFDPDNLIPKVVAVYTDLEAGRLETMEVGAIAICAGTTFFHPADEKNLYGYGVNPGVLTNLEFERLLSGTGPSNGRLVRPHDGRPVQKIAWLQCVGSRDLQKDADFCSSICCMVSIKEALLAKSRLGSQLETAIFYMDMRAFGKSFERYRQAAQHDHGIRFERVRFHSLIPDRQTGAPLIRVAREDGSCSEERFDLVVLAAGQRPARGTSDIAELTGVGLNPWGFIQEMPFTPAVTARQGIVVGGAFTGLKDIGESIVHASAASMEASRVLHATGGSLGEQTVPDEGQRDVSHEPVRTMVFICSCGNRLQGALDAEALIAALEKDSSVVRALLLQRACTRDGWEELVREAEALAPNRILIGACHPYLYIRKLRELGQRINLDPALVDVVDMMPFLLADRTALEADVGTDVRISLNMALSRLKHMDLLVPPALPVSRRALVVGGGIAGCHASLDIADHGYPVDLIERNNALGGNLNWLHNTLQGEPIRAFMEETIQRVEKHPLITVHLDTRIASAFGEVGSFFTTLENTAETVTTRAHGVTILATGGNEAATSSYAYGHSDAIVTQREMEVLLGKNTFDAGPPASVVMIQCVDSRQEPRNYCSRICCPTALKHALTLKQRYPETAVYILCRDIMTHGFNETYYTATRREGVVFVRYEVDDPPQVAVTESEETPLTVSVVDQLLHRPLEIAADLLVLATGVVPELPAALAAAFGVETDPDGFFKEAESKWRPVDGLKEGVFACGLALSPRSIPEAVATARAAAQRSLRILSHDYLPSGKIVATVRHSLCSICERCVDACPYTARKVDPDQGRIEVNPVMCQGCGECATVCPNSAAVVRGFSEVQMFDIIDSALERVWAEP